MDEKGTDELLRLEYVPLDQVVLWEGNPKLHDIGGLAAAFKKHGFKDPAKFEPELNGGKGGLGHGNGRGTTLKWMKQQGDRPPRGIAVLADGRWAMPVLFGVDAKSEAAAKSYAVDHNNLGMTGGTGFTLWDVARLYDDSYANTIAELAEARELPVTVDGDDADALLGLVATAPSLDPMKLDAQLDWSAEGNDTVSFSFGELSAELGLELYADFAALVMVTGSIQEVLEKCLAAYTATASMD